MGIIDQENLLRVLTAYNPWWASGQVPRGMNRDYRRFAFHEAMQRLRSPEIRRTVMLTGARRVGKTTIQYQMIDELLSTGVAPNRILFVSMDHPMLKLASFQDILDLYHQTICPTQDVYYFFDEIQYAAEWELWLKHIHDMQPETRTVVTGSASPALVRGTSESGVGRFSLIQVPTLSFYEYCALLEIAVPELPATLRPSSFLTMTQPQRMQLMLKLSTVRNHFLRYLMLGGFPELALSQNDLLAQQIMREDVVDKVLKRDLPSLYGIRNPTELERIFIYLCNLSSSIVSIEAIARELQGVSRPTVENYISYMASANLIYISLPVEMRGKRVLKASPKIYIADAAIRNAVLMYEDILMNAEEMGKVVETAVYKHVVAFYYQKATQVGYYRGGRADREVDIVVEYPGIKKMLIEVKYREQAPIHEDDAICQLAAESSVAMVITKRAEDCGIQQTASGHRLLRIPAFAFLYLLGHAEKHGYKGAK